MTDDFERDPLTRELRDSLARHAAAAPRGDALAERIIHASERPTEARDRRRGWQTWALPLAAVGAVAAVVGTVVGIENYHPTASAPAGSGGPSLLPTSAPAPTPAPKTTSVAPSMTESPTPIGAPDLKNVRIEDLTFADGEGWGLASADCPDGSPGCTALLHTTDGTTWTSTPSSGLSGRGVTNIRFATTKVGYAFGPHVFLMTKDGGANWTSEPGNAVALETFRGNVIRVTANPPTGCPGPCNVRVETSDLGSTTWTPAQLGPTPGNGVQLARGGDNAYLLAPAHVTGGAETATSVLYRSSDDGLTWHAMSEPCPQRGPELDSTAIAAGGETVSVLCATRQAPHRSHVAVSTDAGADFTAQPGEVPAPTAGLLAGDPNMVLATGGDGMALSTDGGKSWQTVPDVTGHVTWLGFESNTEGRAVTDNRVIWTTDDGGATWTPVGFH